MQKNNYFNKHLIIIFWDLGIGGIQTRMKDIVKETIKKKGRVTILVERRSKEEVAFIKSRKIQIFNFRNDKYEELKHPFRRLERFRFLFWIINKVFLLKADTMLVFLNRFSFFSVVTRKILWLTGKRFRLVLNEGILTSKYLKQYERPFWSKLVKWAYPKSDLIIVPTKTIKNDLISNFSIPDKKIKIIPSWVDIKYRPTKKIYDGIFVGRLSPEKGIGTLVKLIKIATTKKYKFAIVGDGVMKDWLLKEINNNNLQNTTDFLGFLPHEQVIKIISKSKILLLPSRNEGLPMTILEANALGVPAIVMPFGGVEEVVINGETGIITKMNDNDFLDKTLEILKNPYEIKVIGNKAKKMVQKNHSKKNLKEFIYAVFNSD